MTPKEYISAKLDQLIKLFPKIRVRYESDEFSGTHTVEIIPQSEYNKEAMMDWQDAVFEEFFNLYPAEAVCFISDDALVGIEKPEKIYYGSLYIHSQYTVASFYQVNSPNKLSFTFGYNSNYSYDNNFISSTEPTIIPTNNFPLAA